MSQRTPAAEAVDGAFRCPVSDEIDAHDLPVRGTLPDALAGRFVRNGPNPRAPERSHPFVQDGMLHGVRIAGGTAHWYRNRWLRTRSFETGAPYVRWNGSIDLSAGPANTSVVAHAGTILALVESSFPYAVTPDLETLGVHDFGGRLRTPFTAHPKRDPRTGDLHAFGMSYRPAGLTYHRIDAAGRLVESRPIPVKGTTLMHDFALTARHVVFLDLPIVFTPLKIVAGKMPFAWSDRYGARLGVLRRDVPGAAVRWLEIEPCYVFHVMNAYEDGTRIVLDVVRYPELWRDGTDDFPPATLHRYEIDPAAGTVTGRPLDDRPCEFPRIDERRLGAPYRFGTTLTRDRPDRNGLRRSDLATGRDVVRDFGPGTFAGEAVFVPDGSRGGEDDGWLLAFVYDAERDASELVVLEPGELQTVAAIGLPRRVPYGFHGTWIPD